MERGKFTLDWTKREPNDIWTSVEGDIKLVSISCEMPYLNLGNGQAEQRLEEAKTIAVQKILDYYSKKIEDEQEFEEFLDSWVVNVEPYTDPRPNVNMRVLVSVDYEALQLTDDIGLVDSLNSEEGIEIYSTFNTSKLEDQINQTAMLLKRYQADIDKYNGTIDPPLDLEKESERLQEVLPEIVNFLRLNSLEYRDDEEDYLQVGFDTDFKITFLRLVQDGKNVLPQIGFEDFVNSSPFDSKRIMHYFWLTTEMSTIEKDQLAWTQFVDTFVFPTPDIFPSSSKVEAQENSSQELSIKNKFPEIDIVTLDNDSCETFKSFVDKVTEDNLLKSYEFQTTLHNNLLSSPDFSFNPDFTVLTRDNISDLIKQLGTLEAVFKLFLNKMNINDIIKQIMECLEVRDLELEVCFPDPTFIVPTIPFPDFIPTIDIMADLTAGIKASIETLLVDTFVQTIVELLSQLSLEFECQDFTAEFGSLNILDDLIEANTNPNRITRDVENAARQNGREVEPVRFDELSDALGDISLMFTPPEICLLLNGSSNDRNLYIIQSFIEVKYPNLANLFSDKTTTQDVLQSLGRLSNLSVCEDLVSVPEIDTSPNALCDDPLEDLKCKLLLGKGATAKECEEQLAAEKARRDEQAAQLTDLLQNGITPDMPPVFCTTDGDGNIVPGLVGPQHESVDYAINIALDAVFDPVFTSFDIDANQWALTMESVNNIEREVDVNLTSSGGEIYLNPDIQRLVGQGLPTGAFDGQDTFKIPRTSKTGPLYLEDNLLDPSNKRLIANTESYFFNLDVPQDPANAEALTLLDTVFGQIDSNTLTDEQKQQIRDRIGSDTFNYNVSLTFPNVEDEPGNGIPRGRGTVPELLGLGNPYKDKSFLTVTRIPQGSTSEEIFLNVPMPEEPDLDIQEVLSTLPTPVEAQEFSFQQVAFSEYMKQKIQEIPDLVTTPETLQTLLKKDIYTDISSDLVLYISRLVASSAFFDNKLPTYDDPSDSSISIGTPILEDVLLNPPKTAKEEECGIDNSLLLIGDTKSKVRDDYSDNRCSDNDLIEDGQRRPNSPNAIEKSLSEEVVLMTCRLAIIDYYLRGIFALSTVKIEDEKYNLLSAYIARKTIEDLKAANPNLFQKFADKIYQMFFEETNSPTEDGSSELPLVINDGEAIEALTYFILKQMPETVERLTDFLNIGSDLVEVNNNFINKYTPDIWAANDFISKTRFEGIESTETVVSDLSQLKDLQDVLLRSSIALSGELQNTTDAQRRSEINIQRGDIIRLQEIIRNKISKIEGRQFNPSLAEGEITFASEIFDKTISYNGNQFDLTEGNLFLEKYIALTDKSFINPTLFQIPGDVFSYTGDDFANRKTPDGNEYPGLKASTRGNEVIVNPELLSNFLSELAARFGNLTLSDLFEDVKYGVRLIYIPPTKSYFENANETTDFNFNEEILSGPQTSNQEDFFSDIKAYRLYELDAEATIRFEQDPSRPLGQVINIREVAPEQLRVINPIPVVKTELSASEIGGVGAFLNEVPISFLTDSTQIPQPLFYDNDLRDRLKRELIKEPEYRTMFNYIFPLESYASLVTIHSIEAISQKAAVPNTWSATRGALLNTFDVSSANGDYRWESSNELISDQKKQSKYFEELFNQLLDNCPIQFKLPLLALKGSGILGLPTFKFAVKASLDTPKLLFKGLVELIDPNISIAAKIHCLSDKEIPLIAASMGLLPVTVFPPPIGIGPPLTPLGFAYLGLFGLGNDRPPAEVDGDAEPTNIVQRRNELIECEDEENNN